MSVGKKRRKWWSVLSIALTALAASYVTLASPWALAAYACPACFGLEEMDRGIYVEATMPAAERIRVAQIITQAKEQVAAFYGSFEQSPVLLICATAECDRQLGGRGAKAVAFGTSVIRVAPAGINVTIFAHEFSHIELHSRVGMWKLTTGAVASWFDEGVAVIVANDTRYLHPGRLSDDRCLPDALAIPVTSLPTSAFQGGWGKSQGLYAAAACNVLKWMEANGERAGLLAALSDVARGKRSLP